MRKTLLAIPTIVLLILTVGFFSPTKTSFSLTTVDENTTEVIAEEAVFSQTLNYWTHRCEKWGSNLSIEARTQYHPYQADLVTGAVSGDIIVSKPSTGQTWNLGGYYERAKGGPPNGSVTLVKSFNIGSDSPSLYTVTSYHHYTVEEHVNPSIAFTSTRSCIQGN